MDIDIIIDNSCLCMYTSESSGVTYLAVNCLCAQRGEGVRNRKCWKVSGQAIRTAAASTGEFLLNA